MNKQEVITMINDVAMALNHDVYSKKEVITILAEIGMRIDNEMDVADAFTKDMFDDRISDLRDEVMSEIENYNFNDDAMFELNGNDSVEIKASYLERNVGRIFDNAKMNPNE